MRVSGGGIQSIPSNIFLDGGLSGAPAGTPQFPGLLSGYSSRPAWNVAGVDYAVGLKSNCSVGTSTSQILNTGTQSNPINGQKVTLRTANGGTLPTGVSLNTAYFVVNASGGTYQVSLTSGGSPITLGGSPNLVVVLRVPVAGTNCMPPGVSYPSGQVNNSPPGNFVTINPNGASDATNGSQASSGTITIDSYDFSFDNGISIELDGSSGVINVTNCYWRVGSNLQGAAISSGVLATVCNWSYCEVDGGGLALVGQSFLNLGHLWYLPPGGTFKYCWVHHPIHPIIASPFATYTWEFCLVNNMNYGPQAAHNDGIFPAVGTSQSGSTQQFSTWYNPAGVVGLNGANGYPGCADTSIGIFLQPQSGVVFDSFTIDSNVVIGIGQTGHMEPTGAATGAAMGEVFDIEPKAGATISNLRITNNWIDSSGINASHFIIVDSNGAGTVTGATISNNRSLNNNGATIVPNVPGVQ